MQTHGPVCWSRVDAIEDLDMAGGEEMDDGQVRPLATLITN